MRTLEWQSGGAVLAEVCFFDGVRYSGVEAVTHEDAVARGIARLEDIRYGWPTVEDHYYFIIYFVSINTPPMF